MKRYSAKIQTNLLNEVKTVVVYGHNLKEAKEWASKMNGGSKVLDIYFDENVGEDDEN